MKDAPSPIQSEKPKDTISWEDPIESLPGIGPQRRTFLDEQGFKTIGDLLQRPPIKMINRGDAPPFTDLQNTIGAEITAIGTVELTGEIGRYQNKRFIAIISDGSGGNLQGVWFKRSRGIKDKLKPGSLVSFSGKLKYFDGFQIVHPLVTNLQDGLHSGVPSGLTPIYSSSEKWTKLGFGPAFWSGFMRRLIGQWDGEGPYLPLEVIRFEHLPTLKEVIHGLHIPSVLNEYEAGINALKYSELFYHQLLMITLRRRRRSKPGIQMREGEVYRNFIANLPFKLSSGQEIVLKDIKSDLESGKPMHRLVQGEVGAGKTVVAFAVAAIASDSGKQTILMAPTELLARQHYQSAIQLFEQTGVRAALISAGRKRLELDRAYFEASVGGAKLIIGTHALFQEKVKFLNPGLIIIDEQQRFGVRQRAQLVRKGIRPHVLLMTATPIPRTLALAYYGDIDLSILPERKDVLRNVTTRVVNDYSRDKVFKWLRENLLKGSQGFMVFPVIDSGTYGLEAAQAKYKPYKEIDFKGVPIGLVHGRLPIEERIETMDRFRKGEIHLLMATTVIEVGVDIPKASILVLENSERFGLAQIHQLRGRIGRDGSKAYCIMLTPEIPDSASYQRLQKLETSSDGLSLAEDDLKLRGSGEPLGARQSGLPRFKFADIVEDYQLLKRAHKSAEWILDKYPTLKPFPEIREKLRQEYRSGPGTFLAG